MGEAGLVCLIGLGHLVLIAFQTPHIIDALYRVGHKMDNVSLIIWLFFLALLFLWLLFTVLLFIALVTNKARLILPHLCLMLPLFIYFCSTLISNLQMFSIAPFVLSLLYLLVICLSVRFEWHQYLYMLNSQH